jgi:hypothetical protein
MPTTLSSVSETALALDPAHARHLRRIEQAADALYVAALRADALKIGTLPLEEQPLAVLRHQRHLDAARQDLRDELAALDAALRHPVEVTA